MKNNGTPMTHRITLKDRNGRVVGEKEVISLAGLLDLAHREHLTSVDTQIVQFASKENEQTTIVRAVVKTSRGSYSAIADANPQNVTPQIAPHAPRMAETRAIARALRLAVNVGTVAIEELGNDFDLKPEPAANDNASPQPPAAIVPLATAPTREHSSPRSTQNQRTFLYRLLSERGISGDAARTYLREQLGTDAVKDASRAAISALLDRMKNSNGHGASNGTNGHGP